MAGQNLSNKKINQIQSFTLYIHVYIHVHVHVASIPASLQILLGRMPACLCWLISIPCAVRLS